jgi:hypothetical protein
MSDFFVSSLSGASGRQAVVEQSGSSAWLFVTGRDGAAPIADCFLYNVPGVQTLEEAPPPLDPRYASDDQVSLPVAEDDVQIRWSVDGDAVAVHVHGKVVGFIGPDDLRGYSRAVNQDCDWAHRFDEELYRKLFA